VLQHAGTRGVWGHAPQENFKKIDAKILQFRDISTYIYNAFILPHYVAPASVYRKVSVSSNNHMMHSVTISGNIGMWEHSIDLLWPIFKKNFRGTGGATSRNCEIFAI